MSQLGFEFKAASEPKESQSEEKKVLSVSELNKEIRGLLEGRFPKFWIQAEISNFTAHSSGHYYFSLKDKKSQISAVMFKGHNSKIKFKPESGMEVLVRGKITVYEPRGNYQIMVEMMQPVGAGALQLAFEQLKNKLKTEGLFDVKIKKPLPKFPQHVGIVTSPTGAAIRDMIHVLNRRYRGAKITLIPAIVQGSTAAPKIADAIERAEVYSNDVEKIDVLIVGRGGGSIEDLWAFNEEVVARAIANCEIPIVSAVGHEVDYTIADFVADQRAPTPSAAAEIVVKDVEELVNQVNSLKRRLLQNIVSKIRSCKEGLQSYGARLVDPKRRLQDLSQRCDELVERMNVSMTRSLSQLHQKLEFTFKRMPSPLDWVKRYEEKQSYLEKQLKQNMLLKIESKSQDLKKYNMLLDSLSPLKVVDRGYSIVKSKTRVIKSISQVKVGDELSVQLSDGKIDVQVIKGEE